MRLAPLLLAAALLAAGAGPGAAQRADPATLAPLDPGATVAFLGLHFIDTSAEGEINGVRADETARLERLEGLVRDRLEAEGFRLADLAPVAEELERTFNPARCNGCDLRMAERLDAPYVVVGEVQKVSNLILSMNLVLREAATGRQLRGLAVDIRGNTDESWLRGGAYILDHQFFPG